MASATVFLRPAQGGRSFPSAANGGLVCYTGFKNNNKAQRMQLTQIIAGVDWLAVLAATVSAFILGATWYSKPVFGKVWMQEIGLTEEAVESANMPLTFGVTFVLQAIAAIALSAFLAENNGWLEGLLTPTGFQFRIPPAGPGRNDVPVRTAINNALAHQCRLLRRIVCRDGNDHRRPAIAPCRRPRRRLPTTSLSVPWRRPVSC